MKLGKKESNNFFTKPRSGKIFETSDYILNHPEALYILLLMSHIFAVLFFATLFTLVFVYEGSYVLLLILGGGSALSLYKFVKYWRYRKTAKEMMGDMTVNDMLSKKKK